MIKRPNEPSTMRMRSRKSGNVNLATTIARKRKIAAAMNTPRISVFSLPNSRFTERRVSSLRNVFANAAAGRARKFAKLVSGITAPSSEGATYLGTSQRPTKALSKSAMRHAQKSIREYHQKSPSLAWSFLNTRKLYHFHCLVGNAITVQTG